MGSGSGVIWGRRLSLFFMYRPSVNGRQFSFSFTAAPSRSLKKSALYSKEVDKGPRD